MPALTATFSEKLRQLEQKQLRRSISTANRLPAAQLERDGKKLISFSCNDYLGLAHHPEMIKAAQAATAHYGTGAGASRLITGNGPLYDELEKKLAEYKGTQAACVFGSGYLANIGTIPALVGKGDIILADKLVHACMLDAAKLSGAKLLRFAHNDAAHLAQLLTQHRASYSKCLILTETVFSMDGDLAPIAELAALAAEHDSWLMSDDAHGLGIVKEHEGRPAGRPSLEPASGDLQKQIAEAQKRHIQMGTLSKAAGSYGGYVCGTQELIDYIKTSARSLIYSTALPPASLAASITALGIMQNEPQLGRQALENAQRFTHALGLPLAQSTIVPFIVNETQVALSLSASLEAEGFFVSAIRPPTVPENTARLRFTFSAQHTHQQIDRLAGLIKAAL